MAEREKTGRDQIEDELLILIKQAPLPADYPNTTASGDGLVEHQHTQLRAVIGANAGFGHFT